ncbi:MAG: hypothetical protein SPD11_05130 [Sphaerochaetaceae bacterium]|nr:hypothetical protein [Sphaerochaetaceae bacterium]
MSRTTDMEYRVQEFPLCVSGSEVLTDTGWVSVEKSSVPLDDFGELKSAENEALDLKPIVKTDAKVPRRRYRRNGETGRVRIAFSREGQSRALLRSFFW